PCMAAMEPGDTAYFSWHFAEIFAPGRFAIVAREYGGMCGSGGERGDYVSFFIIAADTSGFYTVYDDVQETSSYSMASPALTMPVFRRYRIVPGAAAPFPRRLKITETFFELGKGQYDFPKETGKKVSYADLER
ncbi:MAG TPA: hypothetical protein VFU15_06955, partial [Bacteroidia bacterium]|nr:hypothetical protein [Bacteroidia bacterium]